MRTHPLFAASAICVAMLVLFNVALVPWSQRLPYRRKLDAIQKTRDPDILFVGDSLLDTRLNTAALNHGAATQGQSFRPVNAAFVSSLPPDQALLADYASKEHPDINTMVVGVMDFLLTTDVRLRPVDLTGNHEVGVYSCFPVSLVSKVNQWGPTDRLELRLLRLAPMFAHRRNVWQYVEKLRRNLAQMGMPAEATNKFGRVADMVALEANSSADFDQQAQQFLNDPHFNTSYEQIFAMAQQKHMKVALVMMPMSLEHRERFYSRASWHEYLTKMRALANQRGFTVIDASEWLPDRDDFIDHVHMSDAGVTIFSDELGHQLADLRRK